MGNYADEILFGKNSSENTESWGKGNCPDCGSQNLYYQSLEIQDDYIYYPCTCGDCQCDFKEYYSLSFIETVKDEDE